MECLVFSLTQSQVHFTISFKFNDLHNIAVALYDLRDLKVSCFNCIFS